MLNDESFQDATKKGFQIQYSETNGGNGGCGGPGGRAGTLLLFGFEINSESLIAKGM